MHKNDLIALAVILILGGIVAVALIAGNIVNQLFAPAPTVAGPLGAAVTLFVFVYLVGRGIALVLSQSG